MDRLTTDDALYRLLVCFVWDTKLNFKWVCRFVKRKNLHDGLCVCPDTLWTAKNDTSKCLRHLTIVCMVCNNVGCMLDSPFSKWHILLGGKTSHLLLVILSKFVSKSCKLSKLSRNLAKRASKSTYKLARNLSNWQKPASKRAFSKRTSKSASINSNGSPWLLARAYVISAHCLWQRRISAKW